MSIHSLRYVSQLDEGIVLLPERYDPRRIIDNSRGISLMEIAKINETLISATKINSIENRIILDTTHTYNGVVTIANDCRNKTVGSGKKNVSNGSIIISRLRPYLRQIGYIDEYLFNKGEVFVSSEYIILNSINGQSIAYLIPFLLSEEIQNYLQRSVEGGNHPRFKASCLKNIIIPYDYILASESINAKVLNGLSLIREGFNILNSLIYGNGS